MRPIVKGKTPIQATTPCFPLNHAEYRGLRCIVLSQTNSEKLLFLTLAGCFFECGPASALILLFLSLEPLPQGKV